MDIDEWDRGEKFEHEIKPDFDFRLYFEVLQYYPA